MEIINATDGYKLGHHRMYPEGTEQVYSNWTPRSNKYFPEATEGSVVFGIQYLIKKYLIDEFNQNFFGLPKEKAVEMFYRRVHNFVGIESQDINILKPCMIQVIFPFALKRCQKVLYVLSEFP